MKRRKHDTGCEYTTKEGNYINCLCGPYAKNKPKPLLFLGNSFLPIPRDEAAKMLKYERTRC